MMFKRLIGLTILAFGLLIGGGIHQNVEAAAGSQGGTEKSSGNKQVEINEDFITCFSNVNIVWENGQFTIEDTPKIEQKQPNKEEVTQEDEVIHEEAEEKNQQDEVIQKEDVNNNQVEENSSLNAFEQEVFTLTNAERTKQGLAPLQVDTELSKVAREKSRDMAVNNYFDHNSPTYGSPFDMMRSFGVAYQTAGENIAKGQRSPEEVVNAWMNSPGHRANILNGNFTHIGVGYIEQGNVWTQQFIGK